MKTIILKFSLFFAFAAILLFTSCDNGLTVETEKPPKHQENGFFMDGIFYKTDTLAMAYHDKEEVGLFVSRNVYRGVTYWEGSNADYILFNLKMKSSLIQFDDLPVEGSYINGVGNNTGTAGSIYSSEVGINCDILSASCSQDLVYRTGEFRIKKINKVSNPKAQEYEVIYTIPRPLKTPITGYYKGRLIYKFKDWF